MSRVCQSSLIGDRRVNLGNTFTVEIRNSVFRIYQTLLIFTKDSVVCMKYLI
jgi:hypothetical protein